MSVIGGLICLLIGLVGGSLFSAWVRPCCAAMLLDRAPFATARLYADAMICIEAQVSTEKRSGYDENVGLMAVYTAQSTVREVPRHLPAKAYAEQVIDVLQMLKRNYDSPVEGEYSNGRSSIGSVLAGVQRAFARRRWEA